MTLTSNKPTTIIRTERGLAIAGTRITLYDVMDYLKTQYPPKFIQSLFDLTEEQINVALAYIETNRTEVETEYQQVLQETEELQQYYAEQNRELIAKIAQQLPKVDTQLAWEKLHAIRAKRGLKA